MAVVSTAHCLPSHHIIPTPPLQPIRSHHRLHDPTCRNLTSHTFPQSPITLHHTLPPPLTALCSPLCLTSRSYHRPPTHIHRFSLHQIGQTSNELAVLASRLATWPLIRHCFIIIAERGAHGLYTRAVGPSFSHGLTGALALVGFACASEIPVHCRTHTE